MNKFIIFLVLVAVVVAGWFALSSLSNDYEVTVVDEVSQLEAELAVLDAAVEAGTLTPAQAADARVRITNSLAKINANASGTSNAKLTPAQQAQLQEGLERLKSVLIKYQSTLVAVDVEAEKDTRAGSRGGAKKTLASQFVDTIGSVENAAEEAVEDFVADAEADAAIDQIDAETADTLEELVADESMEDETSTTTEAEIDASVVDDSGADVSVESETEVTSDVTTE